MKNDFSKTTNNGRRWSWSQCCSNHQIQSQSQEFHHLDLLLSCLLSTVYILLQHLKFFLFILISFLLQDFFKASKEQVTINKWYIQFDILVSRIYSAASNSKETSGGKMQLNLSRNWTSPVTLVILSKAEATHPSKLHLRI